MILWRTTAEHLVDVALRYERDWQRRNCQKSKELCAADIKKAYDGDVTSSPWCAEFMWVVCNEVFPEVPFKKTTSSVELRDTAKKRGVLVDKNPSVGSIFWRPRDGGLGHVGLVVDVTDSIIATVEGNSSSAVRGRTYKRNTLTNYVFIHVERIPSGFSPKPAAFLAMAGVLGGGYAFLKHRNVL